MRPDNAQSILNEVENLIVANKKVKTIDVCDKLGIFDWWVDELSISRLKQMRTFLKEAIKLGYTGKCSFKVGATGCANGMWAFKAESTDGYDPKCDCIYHSFTPAYSYWGFNKNDVWYPYGEQKYDSLTTKKAFETAYYAAYPAA